MAALARHRPDDAVLSEEGKDDRRRLSADRAWIIDPLDGTGSLARPAGPTGRCTWRCGSAAS